jgi:hypothetical protein
MFADFNGDGKIDLMDLTILTGNWHNMKPVTYNAFSDTNVQPGTT